MNTATRETKGFAIAATAPVMKFGNVWLVSSQSSPQPYTVSRTHDGFRCTCSDHKYRGTQCKHIFAAAFAALGVSAESGTAH